MQLLHHMQHTDNLLLSVESVSALLPVAAFLQQLHYKLQHRRRKRWLQQQREVVLVLPLCKTLVVRPQQRRESRRDSAGSEFHDQVGVNG
jgi:hypothetical protein